MPNVVLAVRRQLPNLPEGENPFIDRPLVSLELDLPHPKGFSRRCIHQEIVACKTALL